MKGARYFVPVVTGLLCVSVIIPWFSWTGERPERVEMKSFSLRRTEPALSMSSGNPAGSLDEENVQFFFPAAIRSDAILENGHDDGAQNQRGWTAPTLEAVAAADEVLRQFYPERRFSDHVREALAQVLAPEANVADWSAMTAIGDGSSQTQTSLETATLQATIDGFRTRRFWRRLALEL